MEAGLALEPVNLVRYNGLANCYIKAREYKTALPYLEKSRNLSPNSVSAVVLQGLAAAGQGDYEQALHRFEEAAALRRSTWVLGHLGFTLARVGRTNEARKIVAEMQKGGQGGFMPQFDLAVVHAALGEKERAIAALERAMAEFSMPILWLKVDYRLDDLRDHPRFVKLVKAVGLDS